MASMPSSSGFPHRPVMYSPLPENEENRERSGHLFLSIDELEGGNEIRGFNHRHGRLAPVDSPVNDPLTPVSPPAMFGWGRLTDCPSPDTASDWSVDTDTDVLPLPAKLVPLQPLPASVSPIITRAISDPLIPTSPLRRLSLPGSDMSLGAAATVGGGTTAFLPRIKLGSVDRPFSPLEQPLKSKNTAISQLLLEESDDLDIDLEHSFGDNELNEKLDKLNSSSKSYSCHRTADRIKDVTQYPPKSPIFNQLLSPNQGGFQVIKGLGMGGYASVVLCEHISTSKLYALKVIAKKRVNKMGDRVRIKRELHALTQVKPSPFLLHCYSAFESSNALFFITDYFECGDLFYQLAARSKEGHRGFPELEMKLTLAEIACGINHLHDNGFIHRDIKAENIMIDGAGHAKIIDFGLTKGIPPVAHRDQKAFFEFPLSISGSLIYMPPELLKTGMGGRHTDWWAYGVLAHELLTGRTPWSSLTNKKIIQKEISGMRVAPPSGISPAAGMFICSLLKQDPSTRLGTTTSVREASFFSPIDWDVAEKLGLPPALPPSTDVIYSGSIGGSFDTDESAEVLNTYLEGCEAPFKRDSHSSQDSPTTDNLFSLGLSQVATSPPLASANREEQYGWDDDEEDMHRRRQSSVTGGDSWPSSKT